MEIDCFHIGQGFWQQLKGKYAVFEWMNKCNLGLIELGVFALGGLLLF